MGNSATAHHRIYMGIIVALVTALIATLFGIAPWQATAAPGDDDTTFVPTPGCRAFDYRPAPDQVGPRPTPLGAGETHTQQITGDVGNCTGPLAIPADAKAVAMNVTAVGATAQTNLRLYPADLTEVPLLSNLNVSAGQAPAPNKVDVRLSPGGAIKIFNFKGSVSVVGDIVGYYTSDSLSEIDDRLTALEAPTSEVLTIPSAAFDPTTSTTAYVRTGAAIRPTVAASGFLAPVTLPDGATVTKVTMVFGDNSVGTIGVSLTRARLIDSVSTNMADVVSLDAAPGIRTLSTTAIDTPVVDNANYSYYVGSGMAADPAISLIAAQIEYTTA
ncbi:MAG: hypothetical protein AAGA42_07040 [Actinomycetota bacterium]